jgi:dipeptidyl aminopeptidase/acylaminoacyl peptidase
MRIITDAPGINTIGYPTCRSWSADGRSLFVESSRPGPDGPSIPGERQLLQVDIADGKVTHLATLEVEDVLQYRQGHVKGSSQYHVDYSPEANVIVYFDMTGHNMYLLDPDSGRCSRIVHEPEGTIADPPSISTDGTRVVYYVLYPAVENRFFTGVNSVIFAVILDPKKLEVSRSPRILLAYPGRKGPTYVDNPRDQVRVNHCQINPANRDHVSYAHEFHNVNVDGSLMKTRLWQVMADGSGDRPVIRQNRGEGHTHEVFGPKGTSLYYVDFWAKSVFVVDLISGKRRLVFEAPEYLPNHITISPDERFIAADIWADWGEDEHGNRNSGILLVDTQTGEQRVLCRFARGPKHPAHPHPTFSPDGTQIAFTLADGENTQVAVVDV